MRRGVNTKFTHTAEEIAQLFPLLRETQHLNISHVSEDWGKLIHGINYYHIPDVLLQTAIRFGHRCVLCRRRHKHKEKKEDEWYYRGSFKCIISELHTEGPHGIDKPLLLWPHNKPSPVCKKCNRQFTLFHSYRIKKVLTHALDFHRETSLNILDEFLLSIFVKKKKKLDKAWKKKNGR